MINNPNVTPAVPATDPKLLQGFGMANPPQDSVTLLKHLLPVIGQYPDLVQYITALMQHPQEFAAMNPALGPQPMASITPAPAIPQGAPTANVGGADVSLANGMTADRFQQGLGRPSDRSNTYFEGDSGNPRGYGSVGEPIKPLPGDAIRPLPVEHLGISEPPRELGDPAVGRSPLPLPDTLPGELLQPPKPYEANGTPEQGYSQGTRAALAPPAGVMPKDAKVINVGGVPISLSDRAARGDFGKFPS